MKKYILGLAFALVVASGLLHSSFRGASNVATAATDPPIYCGISVSDIEFAHVEGWMNYTVSVSYHALCSSGDFGCGYVAILTLYRWDDLQGFYFEQTFEGQEIVLPCNDDTDEFILIDYTPWVTIPGNYVVEFVLAQWTPTGWDHIVDANTETMQWDLP